MGADKTEDVIHESSLKSASHTSVGVVFFNIEIKHKKQIVEDMALSKLLLVVIVNHQYPKVQSHKLKATPFKRLLKDLAC